MGGRWSTPTSRICASGHRSDPLPVSSVLRDHAIRLNDTELNDESGFPAILEFLHTKVIAQATARMQKLVMAEIGSSAEHLALVTRAELEAARDPAAREAIIAELDRARVEAKELSARSALWQQVLNDGVADLSADADHDLRMRTARCSRITRPESIPVIRPRCGTNWVKNSRTRSPKV